MPADIFSQDEQLAGRREQARGVEPAGLVEGALGGSKQVREGEDQLAPNDGAVRDGLAPDRDLVQRRLPADSARRRGDEVPLRDLRRVEWASEMDGDLIVRLVHRRRVTGRRAKHLRPLDQPLGPQEPDRELVLVSGRAHRDRDRHRLLTRTRCPDLERLLAHDPIAAELDGSSANGDDPGRRHLAGRESQGVHVRSVA